MAAEVLEALAVPSSDRGALLAKARHAAAHALEATTAMGLEIVTLRDPRYPRRLLQIPDPPVALWIRGLAGALCLDPFIAIVGARNASPTGRETARELARGAAASGIAVASGLARGVDAAAHVGTLDGGGVTVAVLAHGLDTTYPPEHRGLADKITALGALVSEFPPGTRPLAHHFPLRNRIISGLTRAVVVVEASDKSGSLITARAALDQGRDVLAVPGNVRSGCYKGSHALIRDGARLVETVDDILEELRYGSPALVGAKERGKPLDENDLLHMLRPGTAMAVDDLILKSGRPAEAVMAELGMLEIEGKVVRNGAGSIRRA